MLTDLAAERATIAALLLDRDAIAVIAPLLEPDDFADEACRLVYAAVLACYRRRTPPDLTLVVSELRASGTLERAGGPAAVLSLMSAAPTAAHGDHYAQIVAAYATRRRLLTAAAAVARAATDTASSLADSISAALQAVTTAGRARDDAADAASMAQVVDDALTQLAAGEEAGITTGLHDVDRLLGHLLAGDLCVVAGRPGHGKTSLALSVARALALRDQATYMVSLEMDRSQILQRLVAMETGVGTDIQRSQRLSDHELTAVTSAYGQIGAWPIWIDDRPGLALDDLRARLLRHLSQHDAPALVVVDYLQRMQIAVGRGLNYAQAVGRVSGALKTLAREIGVPIMALSQLNRDIDRRSERTPSLADLRESGDIEADADQVLFVVRPELFDSRVAGGTMDVYVAKNRHGALGRATCRYDAPRTLVQSLEARYAATR